MAVFCEELGIDLWESIEVAATKPFGFAAFSPGPGVGGHCLPIDPSYLSWRVRRLGYPFRFVELAREVNDRMPHYLATRIGELLNQQHKPVAGSRILLLGVAYKRDVADVSESPAFALARRLRDRGAELSWHDPHVGRFEVDGVLLARTTSLSARALRAADLVVIHTDHSVYDWPAIVADARLVFDARNATAGINDPRIHRL
jgi:UDP-N-acetyl-D-glucosamine dehydrogenase